MNKMNSFQRTIDSRCPDEDDNWRECEECKELFNEDNSECDTHGRDVCDECWLKQSEETQNETPRTCR